MNCFYIIPFNEKPWFKLGLSVSLPSRIKAHKSDFKKYQLTFNDSDVLYCAAPDIKTIELVELNLKRRFNPVFQTEVFHVDQLEEVKNLISLIGQPIGFSDFIKYEKFENEKAEKQIKQKKDRATKKAITLDIIREKNKKTVVDFVAWYQANEKCIFLEKSGNNKVKLCMIYSDVNDSVSSVPDPQLHFSEPDDCGGWNCIESINRLLDEPLERNFSDFSFKARVDGSLVDCYWGQGSKEEPGELVHVLLIINGFRILEYHYPDLFDLLPEPLKMILQ